MDTRRAWWRVISGGESWQAASRLVNLLLRAGAEAFWVLGNDGASMGSEDFLVATPRAISPRVEAIAERLAVTLQHMPHPPAAPLLRLRSPRVALYGGGGAPYNHARIFSELGFDTDFVSAQAVRAGALRSFDVFVVPGGGRTATGGQLRLLGDEGARQVARFVQEGGMYIGSCAGAHNVSVMPEAARPKYGQRLMQLINVGRWSRGSVAWQWQEFPGVGVIRCRNTRIGHPIMIGIPEVFDITHYNGPFFVRVTGALEGSSEIVPLASVIGHTPRFTPGEYALNFSRYPGETNQSVIGGAIADGALSAALGHFGLGRVVVFSSHPEFGYSLEMDDYTVPARMLANAAFWQSAFRSSARRPGGPAAIDMMGAPVCEPPGTGLTLVDPKRAAVQAAVDTLRRQSLDPLPVWLDDEQAMSTFGLSGAAIWRRSLAGFGGVDARLEASVSRLRVLAARILELADRSTSDPPSPSSAPGSAIVLPNLRDELWALERAIHYRAPEAWAQDFGYQGLLRTLDTTHELLSQAARNFHIELTPSADPYAHDDASPYHLLAACYYSAFGLYLNAWYLSRMQERRLEDCLLLLEIAQPTGRQGEVIGEAPLSSHHG